MFYYILFAFIAFITIIAIRKLLSNDPVDLSKLEKDLGKKVITLIHDTDEDSSLFKFMFKPKNKMVSMIDVKRFTDFFNEIDKNDNVSIIINSQGGLAHCSKIISNLILEHKGKVTAYIPRFAFSAATIITLACDEIVMKRSAWISPIDPQLGGFFPARSIIEATDKSKAGFKTELGHLFRDVAIKAMIESEELLRTILQAKKMSSEHIQLLVDELSSGKHTHQYAFSVDDIVNKLKLEVSSDFPDVIYDFFKANYK